MRVLVASNASYAPPKGGSTRSNLAWLKYLASKGHSCRVICPRIDNGPDVVSQYGIEIHRVIDLARHASVLGVHIDRYQPDWVLVSSEDLSHVLLREAHRRAPGRIVYLAHTPQFFPFGPESWNQDAGATEIVRQARGIVAIGQHMGAYIESHVGRTAAVIHPPLYGSPPWTRLSNFNHGSVFMINPCAVKGLPVFLELARQFPSHPFSALAGWGTTSADRTAMAALPNIRILETVPDIEEALLQATMLLMPSLWYEGFGLIVMEAMLRGLPVIASESGGLAEAKQGTGFILPVNPITRYEPHFDETHMPVAVVPDQPIDTWAGALDTLLSNRAAYESESLTSRDVAEQFVSRLDAADFEAFLSQLQPADPPPPPKDEPPEKRLERLSGSKRALLMELLRKRAHS